MLWIRFFEFTGLRRLSITPWAKSGELNTLSCDFCTCLQYLLEKGADASVRTVCGRNCLMAASANGHLPIVRILLAHGKPDVNDADKYGQTALWRACCNGHSQVVRALLMEGKASLTLADQKGRTAKDIAREEGHTSCVDMIEVRQGPRTPHLEVACISLGTLSLHAGLQKHVEMRYIAHEAALAARAY